MATNLTLADAAALAEATSLSALLNTGKLELWDGSQPANADATSGAAVLGVTLTFGNPAFGAAAATTSSATITANAIAAATAVASITATWARFRKSDNTCVMDGTVGTSAADVILTGTTVISSGALVTISSVVHRIPKV